MKQFLSWVDIAARYGLTVRFNDGSGGDRGYSVGPRDCSLRWPDTIYVPRMFGWDNENKPLQVGPEDVLHEMMHLVCASRFRDIGKDDESFVLMQVERAVGALMSPGDFRKVRAYQKGTTIDVPMPNQPGYFRQRRVGPCPEKQSWWKPGMQRAVEFGLLTPEGKPTWRRREKR